VTRDSDFCLDSAESRVQSVSLDAVSAFLRPRHSESVTTGHPREFAAGARARAEIKTPFEGELFVVADDATLPAW
jgi:hypothetical protein